MFYLFLNWGGHFVVLLVLALPAIPYFDGDPLPLNQTKCQDKHLDGDNRYITIQSRRRVIAHALLRRFLPPRLISNVRRNKQ